MGPGCYTKKKKGSLSAPLCKDNTCEVSLVVNYLVGKGFTTKMLTSAM